MIVEVKSKPITKDISDHIKRMEIVKSPTSNSEPSSAPPCPCVRSFSVSLPIIPGAR